MPSRKAAHFIPAALTRSRAAVRSAPRRRSSTARKWPAGLPMRPKRRQVDERVRSRAAACRRARVVPHVRCLETLAQPHSRARAAPAPEGRPGCFLHDRKTRDIRARRRVRFWQVDRGEDGRGTPGANGGQRDHRWHRHVEGIRSR